MGSWRLDRLVHVGKNACVYRAVAADGTVGALKVLRPAAILHRTAAERFAREIAALHGLNHPAIPRPLDQGIGPDELPWFVTPWIVGWDLETHRQRLGGHLPASEVIDVGVRMLEALAHAHGTGFLHRDVKPANLFLTETGELKVLDFGLCRGLAAACMLGITGNVTIGTRGFMAPEQAARRWLHIDARADIWSAGATLFMLASGRPVHEGDPEEQRQAAYRADARSIHSVVDDLPEALVATIDRALLREPGARFQSADEMREALLGAHRPAVARHSADPRPLSSGQHVAGRSTTEQEGELPDVSRRWATTTVRLASTPDGSIERERPLSMSDELLLGRDVGYNGWSIADTRVSRVHLRIAWDERQGCYRASDLQSTNGLRVNGRRQNSVTLSHGDVLRIGDTVLVIVEGSPMEELRTTAEQAARSPATLLVTGETGVGKEVLARQIHEWSGRRGAFVPVNCGALPREIAASELFGHAKGAFSGAAGARRGVFHAAQGGTLLLDEVGELPLELQPLLLRALQERAVRPVGADFEQPVDVRVIAATNVQLDKAVTEGRFRADLYARLAQLPLEIPPLRRRREETLDLMAYFASQAQRRLEVTADAAEALLLWTWPFNVRELENLVRRWCLASSGSGALGIPFLRSLNAAMIAVLDERAQSSPPPGESTDRSLQRNPLSDRAALEACLSACDGNISEVARRMNTTRAQVYRWLERFGMHVPRAH